MLAFDGSFIKASNVTPGGEVVFFAVGIVPDGFESSVMRWSQVVRDDDRDGAVTFDAGRAIPCKSIWVVAEVTNGNFAVGAPAGCPVRHATLPSQAFRRGSTGDLDVFLHSRPYLDLLYVQAGKGVWTVRAGDGYPTDADGNSDGVTTIALSSARSLLPDPAPATAFVPGAALIAIDLYALDVVAVRLDGQMLSEVQP